MPSRRDALKSLAMGSVAMVQAAATPLIAGAALNDTQALAAKQEGKITDVEPSWDRDNYYERIDDDVAELVKYHGRLERARTPEADVPFFISAPFATLPLNVYVRLPGWHLDVAEPKIPTLHRLMEMGSTGVMSYTLNELTRLLELKPAYTEMVETFTLKSPGDTLIKPYRVVSPKYTIDVEEPHYSMRTTANMLVDSAVGIWAERETQMQKTIKVMQDHPVDAIKYKGIIKQQLKPIECDITRTAYMLEFFAWNTGCGYVQ